MAVGFSLSDSDWSLHHKGARDQVRHEAKVREAIRENLTDIIGNEDIITADDSKIIRVPIRSLDLYHFRFDPLNRDRVGQGEGGTKKGDVLGQMPGQQKGPGKGKQAGNEAGIDYYEVGVTLEEISALLFEDLQLPNLKDKGQHLVEALLPKFNEIRKKGAASNVDLKRTLIESLKRSAATGQAGFHGIEQQDLRYRTWTPKLEPQRNAVIVAMRDVSGSMGEFEKYISRAFYFWMVRFLRHRYNKVEIVFITHHTEAKEVDEQAFFTMGESGGTLVSSAYKLALDVIDKRYNPRAWNIYPFHFSDGDTWGPDDNRMCVELVRQLLQRSNLFGYGEIREGQRYASSSTLMSAFAEITEPEFVGVTIAGKDEVYPALRKFFSQRKVAA